MKLEDLFTRDEVEEIKDVYDSSNGRIESTTIYSAIFFERVLSNPSLRDYFTKEFSGKKIIELGTGPLGIATLVTARAFRDLGAAEYIGIDIMYEETDLNRNRCIGIPVSFSSADGLSYLLGQPDESAIVFSSALFLWDALSEVGLSPQLEQKYITHFAEEIGRVTPYGGVSVHVNSVMGSDEIKAFTLAGFTTELFSVRDNGQTDQKNHETPLNYDFCYAVGFTGGRVFRKQGLPITGD